MVSFKNMAIEENIQIWGKNSLVLDLLCFCVTVHYNN